MKRSEPANSYFDVNFTGKPVLIDFLGDCLREMKDTDLEGGGRVNIIKQGKRSGPGRRKGPHEIEVNLFPQTVKSSRVILREVAPKVGNLT